MDRVLFSSHGVSVCIFILVCRFSVCLFGICSALLWLLFVLLLPLTWYFVQRLTIVHQGKVEAAKLMEVEKKTPKEDVGVGRGHLVAKRHVKICQVHIIYIYI